MTEGLNIQKKRWMTLLLFSLLIGAAAFFVSFGFSVLDPENEHWLLRDGGDLTQHYLGWKAYRNGDWMLPPGVTNALAYPYETSVIFTDSIPFMALFFKLISFLLPQNFQYFGLYGLLCFMLQGVLAAILCKKYIDSHGQILACVGFFVFSPVLLQRMFFHTALGSHYLLLAGLCLIVYHQELLESKKRIWLRFLLIAVLSILATGTHMYLLAMLGIILLYDSVFCIKEKQYKIALGSLLLCILLAAVEIKGFGGFSRYFESGRDGLGTYALNLVSPVDAQGWSRLFPAFTYAPEVDAQESFAYLGLGMLVLLALDGVMYMVLLLKKQKRKTVCKKEEKTYFACLVTMLFVVGILAFSLSPVIHCSDRIIATIPMPDPIIDLWSIFRCTGRFAWLLLYPLFLSLLVIFVRLSGYFLENAKENGGKNAALESRGRKSKWIALALTVLLAVQVMDLLPGITAKRQMIEDNMEVYEDSLSDPIWEKLSEMGIKHVYFAFYEVDHPLLYSITNWAANHQMTVNRFYFARKMDPELVARALSDALFDKEPDAVFIFRSGEVGKDKLHYYETAEGLVLGCVRSFEGVID